MHGSSAAAPRTAHCLAATRDQQPPPRPRACYPSSSSSFPWTGRRPQVQLLLGLPPLPARLPPSQRCLPAAAAAVASELASHLPHQPLPLPWPRPASASCALFAKAFQCLEWRQPHVPASRLRPSSLPRCCRALCQAQNGIAKAPRANAPSTGYRGIGRRLAPARWRPPVAGRLQLSNLALPCPDLTCSAQVRRAVYMGPYIDLLKSLSEDPAFCSLLGRKGPDPSERGQELVLCLFALWSQGGPHVQGRATAAPPARRRPAWRRLAVTCLAAPRRPAANAARRVQGAWTSSSPRS